MTTKEEMNATLTELQSHIAIAGDELIKAAETSAALRSQIASLPDEPTEPVEPTPLPKVTIVGFSYNDAVTELKFDYTGDAAYYEWHINGYEADERDTPLVVSIGSHLAKGIDKSHGKMTGSVTGWVTPFLDTNTPGMKVEFAYQLPVISEPQVPEIPELPVEPGLSFPFALQKKGESPRLVRTADIVRNVTNLIRGTHKLPNHPSFNAIDPWGEHGIFGSAPTIIELKNPRFISSLPGTNNVMWSQCVRGKIWATMNDGSGLAVSNNYGKDLSMYISAESLGFKEIHTMNEGGFIGGISNVNKFPQDARAAFRAQDNNNNYYIIIIDLVEKRLLRQWPVARVNYDNWGISYGGEYAILDTLPPSTSGGRWEIFNSIDFSTKLTRQRNDRNELLNTAHMTFGRHHIIDANGVMFDLRDASDSERLKGLGHGVSSGQHVCYIDEIPSVVWTQGGKASANKQINLVTLDGQSFAHLANTTGGALGGVIYANGRLAKSGDFILTYVKGREVFVEIWLKK